MTIEVLGAGSDVTFFSVGAGVRLGFSVRHVACCGWRARDLLRQRASSLSLRDALAPHPGSCGASLVTWQREHCEVVRGKATYLVLLIHQENQTSLPDDNRVLEPPDPMPNSEVKRHIADGSVGLPHVRVGHRQALRLNK